MPAPSIDTQGPLMRRKSLIAKLLAQMQGGQGGTDTPVQLPRRGGTAMPSGAGAMAVRPSNLEPRSSLIASLVAPKWAAPNQPEATRPPDQPAIAGGGSAPPPAEPPPSETATATQPWQDAGFMSSDLYDVWNSMDDTEQARIRANPVARRRFFG